MSPELTQLVYDWKIRLMWRDGGEAARAVWQKIKGIATLEEQVAILEKQFNVY